MKNGANTGKHSSPLHDFLLDPILLNALREDIGNGDITTNACVPEDTTVTGRFTAKDSGVICGLYAAARVFALLDSAVVFTARFGDGDAVAVGDEIAVIRGPARPILTGERVALNVLQHMSGVATMAAALTAQVPETCKIVDTRKTTPGLRVLEKYAVRVGGAGNHRFNLADAVLIKDNHIAAAGGIKRAVEAARRNAPFTTRVEVETSNLSEVQQALDAGADIIMLDNMDVETMRQVVILVGGRALTEASGNMGNKDIAAVAGTGVGFISVGALTHSVRALDISLKLEMENLCKA